MAEYHRKQRRSINDPGHAHFLTYSCSQRLPFLKSERACQWVVDAMEESRRNLDFAIWAYVIMPEHVHILVLPNQKNYEMRRILAALKASVSRKAKAHLQAHDHRDWLDRLTIKSGSRVVFRFWQSGGGYDKNLWHSQAIYHVIEYIHANPVRRGLVGHPRDWKWSSAAAHEGMMPVPLAVDRVFID